MKSSSSSLSRVLRDHAVCCAVVCVMSALLLLTGYYATRASYSSCGEKEKAIALMEMAEEMINKAKELYVTGGNSADFNDHHDSSDQEDSKPIEDSLDTTGDLDSVDASERPRDCSEIYSKGQYTQWCLYDISKDCNKKI
ncbi:hypothetical protein CDAR_421741 [Caerostris darwini]|uniref:Uncharacterized protein n=1 Tax=Caerostris darwini TaxID=1538125 RepID=A0AAV4NKF9_9ARAC|nr:hypothetical protein CDAR_421741 [Caerostris darwini]